MFCLSHWQEPNQKKSLSYTALTPQSRLIRFINTYTPIKPYNVFLRTAANSQFTKNLLLRNNPSLSPDSVTVAPLGVSDYWHEPVTDHEVAQLYASALLGTGENYTAFGWSNSSRGKGVEQAIRALSLLPLENFRNRFRLILSLAEQWTDDI